MTAQLTGILVGLLARLWLATLRIQVVVDPALLAARERPWVITFFHGKQWPLLAWRGRRRTVVLVSLSLDGTLQARALGALGLSVVRGSSSRGGVRGLARVARALRGGGLDAAFAVDGPRGPYGSVKGGASLAARLSGAVVVPAGSASTCGITLKRAWDRFELAWPWSRVVVCLGPPIEPMLASTESLGTAIARANTTAERVLGEPDLLLRGAAEVSK